MSLVVVEPGTSLGEVVSIHVAPARRIPTRSVDSVLAEAGAGLVGDRQAGEAGRERAPVARGDHTLHAVRTGTDGEQAVFVVEREAFGVEAQQRGTVNVGGGVRGRGQGRRRHAGMMTWRPFAGARSGR